MWFELVGRIGAVKAATFHFLNPFLGVAISAIVLDEPFGKKHRNKQTNEQTNKQTNEKRGTEKNRKQHRKQHRTHVGTVVLLFANCISF